MPTNEIHPRRDPSPQYKREARSNFTPDDRIWTPYSPRDPQGLLVVLVAGPGEDAAVAAVASGLRASFDLLRCRCTARHGATAVELARALLAAQLLLVPMLVWLRKKSSGWESGSPGQSAHAELHGHELVVARDPFVEQELDRAAPWREELGLPCDAQP